MELLEACQLALRQLRAVAFTANDLPPRYAALIHKAMPEGYSPIEEAIAAELARAANRKESDGQA